MSAGIKQLLEYVLALPPATATAMLTSLLPLQRQRPELRDHVVLLLRKAMFSRDEPTRLTAVHGFLQLMHTTAPAPTAPTGAGAASTSAGGPPAGERTDEHGQFQLELLGFIRRSLTQQATIRAALYDGIVPAFEREPSLRPMIFELLLSQLAHHCPALFNDDDEAMGSTADPAADVPICIDKCLSFSTDGASPPSLVEPLPQLIRAITRCVVAARAGGGLGSMEGAEEAGEEGMDDPLHAVLARMRMMVDRMALCGLQHLGLSGEHVLQKSDKNGEYHHAIASFYHATLEALLDHTLLCHVGGGEGGEGGEDGPVAGGDEALCMATQAPLATQAAAHAPFGNEDTAVEAARRLFVLSLNLHMLLSTAKIQPKPKPLATWLQIDLSLAACSRVLAALQGEAAAAAQAAAQAAGSQDGGEGLSQVVGRRGGPKTTSKRFARHVLKAIATRTAQLGAHAAARTHAPAGGAPMGASAATRELLDGAPRVLTALLGLVAPAERLEGKEAIVGRRHVNPLTGKIERPTCDDAKPKGKAKGKAKGKDADDADAEKRPKEDKTPSRLLLLLEAVDSCVGLLAAHAPPATLAAAFDAAAREARADGEALDDGAYNDAAGSMQTDGEAALSVALGRFVLPLVERMLAEESYPEADAALRVATRLAATLVPAELAAPLAWSASSAALGSERVASVGSSKSLLGFHLALARRAGDDTTLPRVCERVLSAVGDNMDENPPPADAESDAGLVLISSGNASSLSVTVVDAITKEIGDVERAFTIIRRQPPPRASPRLAAAADDDDDAFMGAGGGRQEDDGGLRALHEALRSREERVLGCLRLLSKAQLEPSTVAPVLAKCHLIVKHATALFKWLLSNSLGSDESVGVSSRITMLCGEDSLCTAMFAMVNYIGTCEHESRGGARVRREAKLIPELIYAVEKFENSVVALASKRADQSFVSLMKKSTARDFRIQLGEVSKKLQNLEAKRRQDEQDRKEKANKKRDREAGKAGGSGAGKKGTAAGKAPAKSGSKGKGKEAAAAPASKKARVELAAPPDEPEEDEEDEEEVDVDDDGEEDDEEGEDNYPGSMVGDGSDDDE